MTKHCDTCTCGQPKPACPTCRKWQTYTGIYDGDGNTLRCHGCKRAVARCTCR